MSPRLAAIGVATLSGLILQCLESTMTAAVIKPKRIKQESCSLGKYYDGC